MCKTISAAILSFALGAALLSAQTQPPQPSQTVTVSGCIQKETDVIKSQAAGNLGMGDEFVLTHSELRVGAEAPKTKEPEATASPAPTGTPGDSDAGKVYRVTGDKEKDLKSYVGQKVEITGTFKHEEDARQELGAVGTTGKPPVPTGELTTANTPEITIESIKATAGSCAGK